MDLQRDALLAAQEDGTAFWLYTQAPVASTKAATPTLVKHPNAGFQRKPARNTGVSNAVCKYGVQKIEDRQATGLK